MHKTIFGVYASTSAAEQAVKLLSQNGYATSDISVITREGTSAADSAATITTSDHGTGSVGGNVAAGAVSGATAGGVIAGLAGLIVGLGAIAIPGLGAILIGGPVAAALGLTGAAATTVSAAATGALAGGLIGALGGLGVPETSARVYEERIKTGGVLLAVPVHTDEQESDVRTLLQTSGADEITVASKMQ